MKLLLVNTVNDRTDLDSALPHLGLGYIAAYLRERLSIEIKIIDWNVKEQISEWKPDIVGISSATENYNIAKDIAIFCKEQNVITIIGGHHITALPETLCGDIGVLGEGEITAYEVIQSLQGGLNKEKLKIIKGVCFRDGDKVVVTERRALIEQIDSLPMPARDLLDIPKGGWAHLFSSRGCPFRCVFCSSSHFWQTTRFFSAEYVMKELKVIIERYNPKHITFSDDLFIADRVRLVKLVELIRKEGIHKKVSFSLKCRANLVNEEAIRLLKMMNCIEIGMGLESGCQKILSFLKNNVTTEDGWNAITIIKKYKIFFSPTFIIGSPEETKADALESLEWIKRSKIDQFNFFTLMPLPATPLWTLALEKGKVSNDMDWDKLRLDPNTPLGDRIMLAEKMTVNELQEIYELFLKEQRKRRHRYMVKKAIAHPETVMPYIRQRFKHVVKRYTR